MSDEQIARQIADRVIQALRPERVIWFGSRATGQTRSDSDFDFLVVADTPLPQHERMVRARLAAKDIKVPMDILVFTPEEHARLSTWTSSVVYEANRTGRVLFEAEERR